MQAGIEAAQLSVPDIHRAIEKWVAARTSGTAPVNQRP